MELYLITNTTNQKRYVGITKGSHLTRWKKHLWNAAKRLGGKQVAFYNAIRKYGKEAFCVECIDSAPDWDTLQMMEIAAIEKYNTFIEDGCGYNMTRGGDGTQGYKFRPEQRAKSLSEEHKANIAANNAKYWKGKTHSAATKDKIRESLEGKHARLTRIEIDGVVYASFKDAVEKLGSTRNAIRKRIASSSFPTYRYIDPPQALQGNVGAKNGKSRKVQIGDRIFDSLKEAGAYLGIHPDNVRNRIKSPNFPDHNYAN
jgi:group I intron endonuclease